MTSGSPARRRAAACAQTESSTSERRLPSSAETIDDPSFTTKVIGPQITAF
jgi:hypothetical protein